MSSERRKLHVTGEKERSPLDAVTDELFEMYRDPDAKEMQHIGSYELPNEHQVELIVDMCRALLFPGYVGPDVARMADDHMRELVRTRVGELRIQLHRQIYRALHHKRQQALGKSDLECTDCWTDRKR